MSFPKVCLHHTAHQTTNTDHLRRHDQSNHIITSIAAAALNCSGKAMIWVGGGGPLQHRLSAQRWADSINMWPNALGTVKCPLAGV